MGQSSRVSTRRTAHAPGSGLTPLVPMPEAVFCRFSAMIQQECGIKMPAAKKTMLEARLRKRLKALHLADFEDYCDYVFGPGGFEHELRPEVPDALQGGREQQKREQNKN